MWAPRRYPPSRLKHISGVARPGVAPIREI